MKPIKALSTLIITLLPFIEAFAQIAPSGGFVLEGTFNEDYSGYIYLRYEDKADSVLVIDKRFTFKGKLNYPIVLATLHVSVKERLNNYPSIYLENVPMKATVSLQDKYLNNGKISAKFTVLSLKGTQTAIIQEDYQNFYDEAKLSPNFSKLLLAKVDRIIAMNPSSPFSGTTFFQLAMRDDIDKSILKKMYSKLPSNSFSHIQRRKIETELFPDKFVDVSDLVVNFTLPDQNGKMFDTSSLKGKWYLIDFWASWCAPCREQIPELKKVYNLNKSKNFQVLGVSIDEQKENWLRAIDIERLPWINVLEGKRFGGTIAARYNVNAIPMNFLVNPEGKIVAKNIPIQKLETVLKGIN